MPKGNVRRPKVPRDVAEKAADRIGQRRYDCRDPDLSKLPDNAVALVEYVCRYQQVPAEVLAEDLSDALLILRHVKRELDELMLRVLRSVRAHEIPYSRIAPALGVTTRQAVEMTVRRLENLVDPEGGSKDDKEARKRRQEAREAAKRAAREREAEERAREALRTPLALFLRTMGEYRGALSDDIVEDVDHLAYILHGARTVRPAAISQGRLLCDKLESLPPGQLPSQVVDAVAKLRAVLPARRPTTTPAVSPAG
jgi:hypothetical protein